MSEHAGFGQRVVVVSPHFDDGALSLGATIASLARSGREVVLLTALAGDPDSAALAGPWDRACGFASAGAAAAARRDEDQRACSILGAEPRWLVFPDEQYQGNASIGRELAEAVGGEVADADTVCLPGFPLRHRDHALLTESVLTLGLPLQLGFYIEQPYASWRRSGRPRPVGSCSNFGSLAWTPTGARALDWERKRRAIRSYSSQRAALRPLLFTRIALYELRARGERVAWLTSVNERR